MSGVIPPFPIFLHGVYRDFKDFTFTPYKPGSGLDVEALQYRHFNTGTSIQALQYSVQIQ